MDVSVIIVNYNTKSLLKDCIQSICSNTHGCSYEIIVVDNASSDGSVQMLKEEFPQVQVIASDTNLGFGKANNLGAKRAKGDYLFLLNSDTELFNDSIKGLWEYARTYPGKLGVVGGTLLQPNHAPNLSFGYFPCIKNELLYLWNKLWKNEHGFKRQDSPYKVDFVCGADMLIPKTVFQKLNGFDPAFFLYYEETDLQKRMEKLNLDRIILPSVKIIHREGGSFEKTGLTYARFMNSQQSYNHYMRKHFSGARYTLMKAFICFIRIQLLFKRDWSVSQRLNALKLCTQ